jgi:hypothetical protein
MTIPDHSPKYTTLVMMSVEVLKILHSRVFEGRLRGSTPLITALGELRTVAEDLQNSAQWDVSRQLVEQSATNAADQAVRS